MRMGNYRFDQNLAVNILETIVVAALVLLVTWALARAAKWAFAKLVDNVAFFRHHTGDGATLGESLGKIVSLLIWLFGLIILLQVLGLGAVAGPIDNFLDRVVDYLPNIIGAAIIFFIGLIIARIVRDLTVTALQTVDFDKWVNRGGMSEATGNPRISRTVGTILYAIIVIFFAIAALDVLDIAAISEPASDMLRLIFAAIPNIIAAAILLGIGYLISKFVVQVLKEVLPGLGVDRAMSETGMVGTGTSVSSIIARIAQVAIILFFAIAATRILGFPELTEILNEVLELGGQVVFGAIVIAIGFLIANILANVIGGAEETTTAGTIVRYATIILFTFMGLQFMGVGEDIVQTAFTALVIGGAVAAALAFGLGGREWAGRKLEEMDSHVRSGALRGPPPKMPRSSRGGATPSASTTTVRTEPGTTKEPLEPPHPSDDPRP
jgi:hypothetical protein